MRSLPLVRLFVRWAPLFVMTLPVEPAFAAESGSAERPAGESAGREDAHREFEAGVQHFRDAQYEAAARAFLRADVLAPSSDALANALVAARRAGAHLLITSVAERSLARAGADPGLVAEARRALAQAANHLSRLELLCEPTPCQLSLDGADVEPGPRYVNPGTHRFGARSASFPPQEQRAQLDAGSEYRIVLHLESPATHETRDASAAEPAEDPLGDAVLYGGIGLTTVLTGLTIASGVDALDTRNALGGSAPQDALDDLSGKTQRTDWLLAGSIVSATLTIGWALLRPTTSEAAPKTGGARPVIGWLAGPSGFVISARGVFP